MFSIPLYGVLENDVDFQDEAGSPSKSGTIKEVLKDVFQDHANPDQELSNYLEGRYDQTKGILLKTDFYESGFQCQITFRDGYYTGQILTNESKLDSTERYYLGHLENYLEDYNIYIPHGGFTTELGFDCLHAGDIWLSRHGVIDMGGHNTTFKTKKYVDSELRKLAQSLRLFLTEKAAQNYQNNSE